MGASRRDASGSRGNEAQIFRLVEAAGRRCRSLLTPAATGSERRLAEWPVRDAPCGLCRRENWLAFDPGLGKTTLVQELHRCRCQAAVPTPKKAEGARLCLAPGEFCFAFPAA
jgi:hypothetical protein